MKKKHAHSNVLEFLKDAGLKVFAVLALLAGGFYVYAISWPAVQPNATSGLVGMFVGESKTAFTAPSTYAAVNQLCATGDSGVKDSHVCTPDEMVNSYNHGTDGESPIFLINPVTTPFLYINNGPPGFLASSNDCGGWSRTDAGTDSRYPNYGSIWDFSQKMGRVTVCTLGTKFACCK